MLFATEIGAAHLQRFRYRQIDTTVPATHHLLGIWLARTRSGAPGSGLRRLAYQIDKREHDQQQQQQFAHTAPPMTRTIDRPPGARIIRSTKAG